MDYINKKVLWVALVVGVFILVFTNYSYFDQGVENFVKEYETGNVKRVIDGDTIVVSTSSKNNEEGSSEEGKHVRLLGINSPEEGEKFYEEGKQFLESLILNKTVRLQYGLEKKGRYGRYLAYVHYNRKNVNREMIRKGYANPYFPSGKNEYYKKFYNAWEDCVLKDVNYCSSSEEKCSECIELEKIDHETQEVVLLNTCSFSCNLKDWEIKDEGRKKFTFPDFVLPGEEDVKIIVEEDSNKEICDSKNILCWEREHYVWTDTGDAIFLRDSSGKLVLWENY